VRLQFLEEAVAEAESAVTWYERRRSGLGQAFAAELDRAFVVVAESPRTWARVPRVAGLEVRRFLLGRFPYEVVFLVVGEEAVVVIAVAHCSRQPQYWAARLAGNRGARKA
jgi:plasmid stabilization system protein ParE